MHLQAASLQVIRGASPAESAPAGTSFNQSNRNALAEEGAQENPGDGAQSL